MIRLILTLTNGCWVFIECHSWGISAEDFVFFDATVVEGTEEDDDFVKCFIDQASFHISYERVRCISNPYEKPSDRFCDQHL